MGSASIIKLGGSVLYDQDLHINIAILRRIRDWVKSELLVDPSRKFGFAVGGGRVGRFLLDQIKSEVPIESAKHRIAMELTQVNATILAGFISDLRTAYVDRIDDMQNALKDPDLSVVVMGGVVEGWSTDMDAAQMAAAIKADTIYKISSIDKVYSMDPNVDSAAKPFDTLSWSEYKEIFLESNNGEMVHKPNMHAPIDINCVKFCEQQGLSYYVSGGKNLDLPISELLVSGTYITSNR